MSVLRAEGISKSFRAHRSEWHRILSWFLPARRFRHEKQILHDIDFQVGAGEAVGIVGENGAGKSTLLKILAGTMQPTSGKVHVDGRVAALLELGMGFNPAMTGRANALNTAGLMGFSRAQAEAAIPGIEDFAEIGDYFDQPIRIYSSGMQVRLAFAVATAFRPEILIVDEALSVGDAYFQHKSFDRIRQFRAAGTTLLLVSHDRSFLDNTVTGIYNLRDGRLSVTKGNYSSWKEADEIARLSAERQYERQQKHINETMEFIRKNMAGQKTNQAKSRLKQLERMELVERPLAERQLRIRLDGSSRSGNDLFMLKDLSFSAGEKLLATQVNLLASYQQRICVIGPNGCGKTTLLRMLIGKHSPDSGLLKTGASLKIAYYDQHHVDLDGSLTVMDTLWQLVPDAPRGYVLSWLARFGFRGDDVDKSVSVLSGGEKSRLYLSVLIHSKPNLLIMDEPTNHLDIQMADALLEALLEFEGSIIFVSHDRWFLSRLATRFWVFRKLLNGNDLITTVEEVDGSSDEAIELSFSVPEPPKAAPVIRERKRRINPRLLEMKHAEIENRQEAINALRDELHSVQASLSLSSTYNDPKRLRDLRAVQDELQSGIASVAAEIERLEHEYLELLCEE